jgi:hypothetical protein
MGARLEDHGAPSHTHARLSDGGGTNAALLEGMTRAEAKQAMVDGLATVIIKMANDAMRVAKQSNPDPEAQEVFERVEAEVRVAMHTGPQRTMPEVDCMMEDAIELAMLSWG